MKKSIPAFICEARQPVPPVVTADLNGKTVMVVGANTGLGLEAAKHFAKMNPTRLIIVCRNAEKGKGAITEIAQETGYTDTELMIMDLSDFASVLTLADSYEKSGAMLDILVMNAGIATTTFTASPAGWESTLQVNHLSTALFSILMVPTLLRTAREHHARSRLVVVSSDMHYWFKLDKKALDSPNILEKLNDQHYCSASVMRDRYPISKLLNVFFVRAMNSHLPKDAPLVVDTANPGYCYSELRREYGRIAATIDRVLETLIAHTTEEGSRALVYGAIGAGDEEQKLRGQYVSLNRVEEVADFVLSEEGQSAQARIWSETVHILGRLTPDVHRIVQEQLNEMA